MGRKLKSKIGKLSIFQKIITVVIVVIIASNVFSNFVSRRTMFNIVTDQIYDSNFSILKSSQMSVSNLISQASSILVGLSMDTSLQNYLTAPLNTETEQISNINKVNSLITNYTNNIMDIQTRVIIVSSSGKLFANFDMPGFETVRLLKNKYKDYCDLINKDYSISQSIYWEIEQSEILGSLNNSQNILSLTLPIRDECNDKILGIAILMLPEKRLQELISFSDDVHNTIIVDKDEHIVSCADEKMLNKPLSSLIDIKVPKKNSGNISIKNGNENVLVSYQELGKFKWYIMDIMDNSYVNNQVNKLTKTINITNILIIIVLSIITYFLARSITKPLKRLTEQMVKMDYENFESSNKMLGKNEVRMLQRSFRIMKKNISKLMAENQKKGLEKRELEIKALQSQIRPHFLFNTLNTIRCSAMNNNGEKAADMVLALSMLLRMTLVKGDELIPLREELEGVQYYVSIIQMRHSISFEVVYEVDKEAEGYRLPKLLIQPLVENSITHGFEHKRHGGIIKISAKAEDGEVIIRVADNGEGEDFNNIDPETSRKKSSEFSGMGVGNVNKRVKLYFGEDRCLKLFRNQDNWTIAEMRLPKEGGISGYAD